MKDSEPPLPPDSEPQPPEASPLETRPDRQSLDRSLVQGVAWTSAVKWGVQVITWVATIMVMRLLTPEDYGLVGMAGLFLGLVALVSEFGLGSAVVALRNLTERQIAQLHAVSIIIGTVALVITAAAAQPVAAFFESPRLTAVVLALSTTFLISALQVVPGAILRRDLQYRTLAFVEGGQAIADVTATLILAWLGFGYWSLVLGRIVKFAVGSLALLIISPQRFALPRIRQIQQALTFSTHVITSRLGWYTYSNADYLIIGKVLGQAPLGLYEGAFTLSRMPAGKITGMVLRVTPGIFSAVQDDPEQLRRYIRVLTEGLSILTFPALVGIGLVASELIPVVLGGDWIGAVAPLQILSVGAAITAVTPILPQVLHVIGETGYEMRVSLIGAVVFTAGFLVGIRWGVTGVAVAWLVLQPTVVVIPTLVRIRSHIGLSFRAYAAALWPAASSCLVMAAAVLTARSTLIGAMPQASLLATEVAIGATVYAAVILLLHRQRIHRLVRAVKLLRG